MLLTTIHLLALTSIAFASPLSVRGQYITTITSTVTVGGPSVATTTPSQPLQPIFPTNLQQLSNVTVSPVPIAGSPDTTSLIPIIPTVAPAAGNSSRPVSPVHSVTTASSLSPKLIIPTTVPTASKTDAPKQCKKFCKTNVIQIS